MPNKIPPASSSAPDVGKTDWVAVDALTEAQVIAAASVDDACPPSGLDQVFHKMARAKSIRLKLRLSQEEFAARFHIPRETLAAWERHKCVPDAVAQAFLDAIAADPEGVAKALAMSKPQAAE